MPSRSGAPRRDEAQRREERFRSGRCGHGGPLQSDGRSRYRADCGVSRVTRQGAVHAFRRVAVASASASVADRDEAHPRDSGIEGGPIARSKPEPRRLGKRRSACAT